uniref:AI-2E family transporter n=1 Tax=Parerythrobacter lutipelagi TaxID=1964208 RepID=UPI0010F5CB66|nr:AI-2E family transporter [Parerythrobacter lutipelagi]
MNIDQARIERRGFFLFLALATIALLYISWPFAAPLLWATLAAIMFQPLNQWFLKQRYFGANRAAIATLLVITFAVILPSFLIGSAIIDQAIGVVIAFREGRIDVTDWFATIMAALPGNVQTSLDDSGFGNLGEVRDRAQEFAEESVGLIAQQALSIGGSVFGFVLAFGVGIYVTYFLLRDGKAIGESVMASVPLERSIAERLTEKFLGIVRATIKGSVVVGLVQGALGAITFWIVGVPSALLLGLLMAIASLIPALGPALIWVPAAVYLLATGEIWQGVVVIVSGVALIGMADNVLRPLLVGRDTGIPDWMILITTLGGIALIGLSGIVLGPLAAGLFLAGWAIYREQRAPANKPAAD